MLYITYTAVIVVILLGLHRMQAFKHNMKLLASLVADPNINSHIATPGLASRIYEVARSSYTETNIIYTIPGILCLIATIAAPLYFQTEIPFYVNGILSASVGLFILGVINKDMEPSWFTAAKAMVINIIELNGIDEAIVVALQDATPQMTPEHTGSHP